MHVGGGVAGGSGGLSFVDGGEVAVACAGRGGEVGGIVVVESGASRYRTETVVVVGGRRRRRRSGAGAGAGVVVAAGRRIDGSNADVVGTFVDHAAYVGDEVVDPRARGVARAEQEHV